MFSFFSGIGGKIMAGIAATGVFIIALMRMQSRARKDERNRIEGESAKKSLEVMKDAHKERDITARRGPDAALERLQRRRDQRKGQ